jgi:NADH:ubiquinone oxidoreductase subunit 6 (subunit J)
MSNINLFIFFFLWVLSLSSSILMIGAQNPVYSTLFMISIFVISSILLGFLHVEYLGLIFLMVYVGAIAILFLFVIMMVPIKQFEIDNSVYITIGMTFLFFFFITIYTLTHHYFGIFNFESLFRASKSFVYFDGFNDYSITKFKYLGVLVFTKYYIHLFICGMCLLIAMIGSIFLTNEQEGKPSSFLIRKQTNQLGRLHTNQFVLS